MSNDAAPVADYTESRKRSLGHNRAPTPFVNFDQDNSKKAITKGYRSGSVPANFHVVLEDAEQEFDVVEDPYKCEKLKLAAVKMHKRKSTPQIYDTKASPLPSNKRDSGKYLKSTYAVNDAYKGLQTFELEELPVDANDSGKATLANDEDFILDKIAD